MRRHATSGNSPRRTGRIRAILAAGTVLGLGAAITFATLSDNTAMNTTFSVGSIDMSLNDQASSATTYNFSKFTGKDMTGGETVYAPLTVHNNGTLPFTYTMAAPTAAAGDNADLGAKIQAAVKVTDNCSAPGWAAATEPSATIAAPGALSSLQIPSQRIEAGATQQLCFMATFPADQAEALQGAKYNPTFQFNATEIAKQG